MKEINQTLANFKKDTVHFGGPRRSHEDEPTRDPDVWPPPAPVERDNRYIQCSLQANFHFHSTSTHSLNAVRLSV